MEKIVFSTDIFWSCIKSSKIEKSPIKVFCQLHIYLIVLLCFGIILKLVKVLKHTIILKIGYTTLFVIHKLKITNNINFDFLLRPLRLINYFWWKTNFNFFLEMQNDEYSFVYFIIPMWVVLLVYSNVDNNIMV